MRIQNQDLKSINKERLLNNFLARYGLGLPNVRHTIKEGFSWSMPYGHC